MELSNLKISMCSCIGRYYVGQTKLLFFCFTIRIYFKTRVLQLHHNTAVIGKRVPVNKCELGGKTKNFVTVHCFKNV